MSDVENERGRTGQWREEKEANGEDDKKESLPPIVCILNIHYLLFIDPRHQLFISQDPLIEIRYLSHL